MLEYRRYGCRPRIDEDVDSQRLPHALEGAVIDQAERTLGPFPLCHHPRKHVDLVVIGHTDHEFRSAHPGFPEHAGVQTVAMQHHRALEPLGGMLGTGLVGLDQPDLDAAGTLEGPRHIDADIAGPDHHDPADRLGIASENVEHATDLRAFRDDIDVIARQKRIRALGDEQGVLALYADHSEAQVGKELHDLFRRRSGNRRGLLEPQAQQLHTATGKDGSRERARRLDALQDGAADLQLRRDHDVDREIAGGEEIAPGRVEIVLRPHPRDPHRRGEQRVSDLTGDHVHLVGIGHRHEQVRLGGTGLFQDIRVGCMADHAAHVEIGDDIVDQFGRPVDDRHRIALAREGPSDAHADLSGSADYGFHDVSVGSVLGRAIALVRAHAE